MLTKNGPSVAEHARSVASAAQAFADFAVHPSRLNAAGRALRGKDLVRAVLIMRATESLIAGIAAPKACSPDEIRAAANASNMRLDTTLQRMVRGGEVVKTSHGHYSYTPAMLDAGARRLAHVIAVQDGEDDEPP